MRVLLISLLFMCPFLTSSTYANEAMKEGAKDGAKNYAIQEAAKYAIDQAATESFKKAADLMGSTPGGIVGGVYSLITSLDQLSEAKTDRQRFYGLANTGASIMILASNPAGWIISTAVLLDNIRLMMLGKTLARIEKRIAEINKQYIEIKTSILTAQASKFIFYFQQISKYSEERNTNLNLYDQKCNEKMDTTDLVLLDNCITYANKVVVNQRLYFISMKQVLSLHANDFSLDDFLVKAEVSREDFETSVRDAETLLTETESKMKQSVAVLSKAIAQTLIQRAIANGYIGLTSDLEFSCQRFSLNILESLAMSQLNINSPEKLGSIVYSVNETEKFLSQGICQEFIKPEILTSIQNYCVSLKNQTSRSL